MLAERAESVQWRRGTAIRSKRSGVRKGCVSAPWWAHSPVSRGVRHRRAPLRIAYSMLRAVTHSSANYNYSSSRVRVLGLRLTLPQALKLFTTACSENGCIRMHTNAPCTKCIIMHCGMRMKNYTTFVKNYTYPQLSTHANHTAGITAKLSTLWPL